MAKGRVDFLATSHLVCTSRDITMSRVQQYSDDQPPEGREEHTHAEQLLKLDKFLDNLFPRFAKFSGLFDGLPWVMRGCE